MSGKKLMNKEVNHFLLYTFIMFCIAGHFSCNNEIVVGSDLLDDESILIDVTDDISLRSTMLYTGPFIVFDSIDQTRRTVFLGKINDGEFGSLQASLALTFNMNSSTSASYPIGEKSLKADSLILALTLDTLATYGDLSMPFRITVKELTSTLPSGRTINSDLEISSGMTWLDTMIMIRPKDTVKIVNPSNGSILPNVPQIRLKMPSELANRIISDKAASTSDSAFVQLIKGVYIEAIPLQETGMTGFNLSTTALSSTLSNKLIMYYTESDTVKKSYNYNINRRFVNTPKYEASGSVVDQYIQDSTLAANISYIQGFGGPRMKINLDNLDIFNDKIVNFARLEIWAEPSTGMMNQYLAPNNLFAFTRNKEGDIVTIKDINSITFSVVTTVFGGVKENKDGKVLYKMNITNQLKEFIKDPSLERNIYITVPSQREYIERAAFFGSDHDTHPMKIKVNFTNK